MKKYIPLFVCLFWLHPALTAQSFRLEGKVLDSQTRYPVSGAEIKIDQTVIRTDNIGIFQINYKGGILKILVKQGDFEEKMFDLTLRSDTSIILLYDKIISIDEVKVTAYRERVFTRDKSFEIAKITPSAFTFLPSVGSNDDLLKKVQLLPGFQSAGEGSSGLIVRGGQYDQNLITINGFPIYQLYHFSGFLSAVDPFLVSDIEIMKGGFSAKYGGKLSSVVNFNYNNSVTDTVLSSIDAGLTVSGAAVRFTPDTLTSLNISGRIGTTSILKKIVKKNLPEFPFYNFYDLDIGASRKINLKNEIDFTFFLNKDYLNKTTSLTVQTDYGDTTGIGDYAESGWEDILTGILWINKPLDNLKIETRLYYQTFLSKSRHEMIEFIKQQYSINEASSSIQEIGFTNNWTYEKKIHLLNFGLNAYFRRIRPEMTTSVLLHGEPIYDDLNPKVMGMYYSQYELSPYVEDKITLNKNTIFRPGLRLLFLSDQNSLQFKPEPRFLISHQLSDFITLMSSYVVTTQSIQQISSSNIMSTADLWIPAGNKIRPSTSNMAEMGIYLSNNKSLTAEINLYYKKMKNLYAYKDGASFLLYPNWQDNITMATGKSYGSEILIQGKFKKIFGMLGYTISRTTRVSPLVNDGKEFRYKFDKPHNLNLTFGYKPSDRFNVSCNWVFQSGILNTFETRTYQRDFIYMYYQYPYIDKINNLRYPYYHRLDLGCEYRHHLKWGKIIVKLDVYNVYSRLNPWYIESISVHESQSLWQFTLFPIFPSINLKVEF